jgi:hypothetical protein
MIKKTVSYTDYNGQQQVEDLYFHLSKSEIFSLHAGGIIALLDEVSKKSQSGEQNHVEVVETFKKLIGIAYGVKSSDGKRFHKSEDQTADFLSSPAYDAVFMEILEGGDQDSIKFVLGMLPADISEQTAREAAAMAGNGGLKVVLPITDVPLPGNKESIDFVTSALAKQLPELNSEKDPVPDAFKPRKKSPEEMTIDELEQLLAKKRQSAG